MERFIEARIRTTPSAPVGRELGYKLPRWMLLARNRDAVLAGLAKPR
ncbi:hypothetical protein AB0I53_12420 [Saccharopolyspora sp. NPDC050389]